jgi:hypothetical protein
LSDGNDAEVKGQCGVKAGADDVLEVLATVTEDDGERVMVKLMVLVVDTSVRLRGASLERELRQ